MAPQARVPCGPHPASAVTPWSGEPASLPPFFPALRPQSPGRSQRDWRSRRWGPEKPWGPRPCGPEKRLRPPEERARLAGSPGGSAAWSQCAWGARQGGGRGGRPGPGLRGRAGPGGRAPQSPHLGSGDNDPGCAGEAAASERRARRGLTEGGRVRWARGGSGAERGARAGGPGAEAETRAFPPPPARGAGDTGRLGATAVARRPCAFARLRRGPGAAGPARVEPRLPRAPSSARAGLQRRWERRVAK